MIKLYDLTTAESNRRFSPYCWRVKMALKHKQLPFEEIPCLFTDKELIAFSGQKKVPILVDGEQTIIDSWDIANYLETTYNNQPSLFGSEQGKSFALFIKFWIEESIQGIIFKIVLLDLFEQLNPSEKAYFRTTREQFLGMTLEEFASPTDETITLLRNSLKPLGEMVNYQPYLGGKTPNFADYIAFAPFQWARVMSPIPLLTLDDPVYLWRERLLSEFDGYAKQAIGYDV
ncbi:MAG: glutathione S-transferase N-terminal domain-containing protein [Crocosphaera sp.]